MTRRHRRQFLRAVGSASAAWLFSEKIPFAQNKKGIVIEGKEGLTILNDRPINAETPIALAEQEDYEKAGTLLSQMRMELDWLLRILDQNRCSGNL